MLKAGGGQSVARMQPRGVWRRHFCAGRGWGCPSSALQLGNLHHPHLTHTHPEAPAPSRSEVGLEREAGPDVGRQMNFGPSAHGNPRKELRYRERLRLRLPSWSVVWPTETKEQAF